MEEPEIYQPSLSTLTGDVLRTATNIASSRVYSNPADMKMILVNVNCAEWNEFWAAVAAFNAKAQNK